MARRMLRKAPTATGADVLTECQVSIFNNNKSAPHDNVTGALLLGAFPSKIPLRTPTFIWQARK
jgi:hypothetical protein